MANLATVGSRDTAAIVGDTSLSLFQKVLLCTDGTVTQLLELYSGLPVTVNKLEQRLIHESHPEWLQTVTNDAVLKRAIMLRNNQQNLLYAESYFVVSRLPVTMQQQLLESNQPIGLLWRAERMETYREIVAYERKVDSTLAQQFGVATHEAFLSRTYLIFHHQKPMGMITEKFPLSYFRN
jgi:chorismate-pyruvate lyase